MAGRYLRATARHALAVAAAVGILAAGCGDNGDDPDDESPTTTTTQPSTADDEEQAHQLVESLVLESRQQADELYQDPAVIEDPNSGDWDRFVTLHTPDSLIVGSVGDRLRELVDLEARYRPAPHGRYSQTTVFDLTTVDDDLVRFQFCMALDFEAIDTDDNVHDATAEVAIGVGEANRIDGTWRLHTMGDYQTTPRTEGTIEPDECEQFPLDTYAQQRDLAASDPFPSDTEEDAGPNASAEETP